MPVRFLWLINEFFLNMPKELSDNPIKRKSINTKIMNKTLLVSMAPTVMNNVKIKYPTNVTNKDRVKCYATQ